MNSQEAMQILNTFLQKKKLKFTQQRQVITEVFFDESESGHPTVEDLYLKVKARDAAIGYATVYRTMKLLVESGLANPNRMGDNQTRYEPENPGEHHDHLICQTCGLILEFENDAIEKMQKEIAEKYGFNLADHKMMLYGTPKTVPCEIVNCLAKANG
jgi:Fur family ferric uptake transcriptional regulator